MDVTWIKLYRKLIENDIFHDANALKMFLWLLVRVDRNTGKKKVARYWTSQELRLNPSTYYKVLSRLEKKYKIVTTKVTSNYTEISLVNWRIYQSGNNLSNNLVTPKEHQSNTLQEERIEKKIISKDIRAARPLHGNEDINNILKTFTERQGYEPSDKYPRQVAQHIRLLIQGFIKRREGDYVLIHKKDLSFDYTLQKSWDWLLQKDYAEHIEKLETYKFKLRMFLSTQENKIIKERSNYDKNENQIRTTGTIESIE